jgi:hypothetical protein
LSHSRSTPLTAANAATLANQMAIIQTTRCHQEQEGMAIIHATRRRQESEAFFNQ